MNYVKSKSRPPDFRWNRISISERSYRLLHGKSTVSVTMATFQPASPCGFLCTPSDAEEPMHYEWRMLRADQLRDQARRDAIVILPVASLEQHGPHLPVEVDSILGETVAARTAEKVLAKGLS